MKHCKVYISLPPVSLSVIFIIMAVKTMLKGTSVSHSVATGTGIRWNIAKMSWHPDRNWSLGTCIQEKPHPWLCHRKEFQDELDWSRVTLLQMVRKKTGTRLSGWRYFTLDNENDVFSPWYACNEGRKQLDLGKSPRSSSDLCILSLACEPHKKKNTFYKAFNNRKKWTKRKNWIQSHT